MLKLFLYCSLLQACNTYISLIKIENTLHLQNKYVSYGEKLSVQTFVLFI